MNSRRANQHVDDAIERLQTLRARMTGRRRDVLEKLVGPGTERQIALELGMRLNTVHSYTKMIYLILDVHNRGELRSLLRQMEFDPAAEHELRIVDQNDTSGSIKS